VASPSGEQVGVEFLTKSGFKRSITGVDTTNDTVTVDDPDHALGDELSPGDAVAIEDSTGNDGDYTVSSVDTATADRTTVTTNESISDSTADGSLLYKPKVGGSISATRTRSVSMVETTNKDSGRWEEQEPSTQEESIEFDSMFFESGAAQTGLGMTVTIGGSDDLKGVNSVTISVNLDLVTVANNDTSRWAEREPSTRSVEVSIDRDYIDPQSDPAFQSILNAADNGTTVGVNISLQTFSIEFDMHPSEEESETPHDDLATSPITLVSDGSENALSRANQQSGLGTLFSALFASPPQPMHNRINVVDAGGAQVSGATRYEMESYPESLEIEIPVEDSVNASGAFQNDGAPTRTTQ
jgi:hypothetical protein